MLTEVLINTILKEICQILMRTLRFTTRPSIGAHSCRKEGSVSGGITIFSFLVCR